MVRQTPDASTRKKHIVLSEMVCCHQRDLWSGLMLKDGQGQSKRKCQENRPEKATGIFDRLDEIMLEIIMLKKELSATLGKSI